MSRLAIIRPYSHILSGCLITKRPSRFIRKFGSQTVKTAAETGKFSLTLSTKTSKQSVINELNHYLIESAKTPIAVGEDNDIDNGAAIFASRDFASWLEDESFVSSILGSLFKPSQGTSKHIDILCAVTDGLTPEQLFSEPRTGFSILYGSANKILPDLWNHDEFGSGTDQDREASVSFLPNPLPKDLRPLEITLPLANTVFQTGKRSTLFASRWQFTPNGSMTRTMMHEKRVQKIQPDPNSSGHTIPCIPLLPLTRPRKIVAGLGNIVRQVEVNGSPTPASKELEGLIPKVFDTRSKRDESYVPGPIGVWCWIIHPHLVNMQGILDLKIFEPDSSLSEAELSLEAMDLFSTLISSGCRAHKILSGGGGWGAKQGLLSLDPETNYSLPDQDDVEMFIKAFQERNNPNQSQGLVMPGTYLMFCIEPHWTEKEIRSSQKMTPATVVGVAPNQDEELNPTGLSDNIEVIADHFGVVSKAGLFLRASTLPLTESSTIEGSAEPPHAFTTKVDLPRTSFIL